VYVSNLPEEKNREYRLIDNKTSEMSQWDHSALVIELREFEESLLAQFFPDVSLEIDLIRDTQEVTSGDVEKAAKKVLSVKEAPDIQTTKIECPACFHTFNVRTSSLPGLSQKEMAEMSAGGSTE
jgi:hypothetical protein